MWLSLKWIQDFVDYTPEISPSELGVLISLRVAEVEDVKILGESLSQVRVVEVLETQPHPDADKLKLATLTDGKEQRTIVCGASNCRPGIKIPFADLGAKFEITGKDGKTSTLVIKPTKIRGVESTGMLCSASELGLEAESDGILELPADTPLGLNLSEYEAFSAAQDTLFEVDNKSLTHRPDLWGHYGFAREFSAIFGLDLKPYPGVEPNSSDASAYAIQNDVTDLCRRYSALEVKNVKVGPSPEWMKLRLEAAGLNSKNNIVDITNYILLELGQPMHAFDTAKLKDQKITVRTATEGESFKALDEETYTLNESDIVIDNAGEAVALAGIMGGLDSSIDENTTSILLESANFDAATVRRSSTRIGLRSDSSARFEKSLDPENTTLALKRALQLILELCPEAEVVGQIADSYDTKYERLSIDTSIEFLQKRLGTTEITEEFIREKLTALGFGLEGNLKVAIPTWRATKDVSIQEDIVEEVGRMYGYDNIKPYSLNFEIKPAEPNNSRKLERQLKSALTDGLGFTEVLLYPWTGDKQLAEYGLSSEGLMTLSNAVSEESKYMRPSTIPHFVDAIAENMKYFDGARFFEFGRIYDTTAMKGLLPTERFKLTGAIVPAFKKKDLQTETFYEVKALVQDLLQVTGITGTQVKPLAGEQAKWVHPGIACGFYRGKQLLAEVFKLHPAIAQKKGLRHNPYIFVTHFDEIEKSQRKFKYKAVNKFPGVPFDITVVADEKTLAGDIQKHITKAAKNSLRELSVFSVYQGDDMEAGKKSVSFRMTFGSDKKTLEPEEVTKLQEGVIGALDKAGFPLK